MNDLTNLLEIEELKVESELLEVLLLGACPTGVPCRLLVLLLLTDPLDYWRGFFLLFELLLF
jgi:hypothetical protein